MRTYIFTKAERQVLTQWLTNRLQREESPLLHTTLTRLRRAENQLVKDLKLFTLTAKRLHLSPKLRKHRDETYTTLTITTIPIQSSNIKAYVKLINTLEEAEQIANNENTSPLNRLKATQIAAETGISLLGAGYMKHESLKDRLKELKQQDNIPTA
jgi:hypothetical protein